MSRPYLVPFKAEHLLEFVNRDIDERATFAQGLQRERGGPAFTGFVDDKILGCGGVILMWSGVGSAWVSIDKEAEKYGIWMTRVVKRALQDIMYSFNLHRVEAVVLADDFKNVDWILLLGFRLEKGGFAQAYTKDKRDVTRFEFLL